MIKISKMVILCLLLIFHASAQGGITSNSDETNILHSPWKWLADLLVNYPAISTILSVIVLMTLFFVISSCKKRWQKESDVRILLYSRSLNKKEKKSLLG
ncbi:unnamed protein product [Blepharisma stoltei]|uniref:ATP synthase F0 subunit 8 n=1 Tax=Blepharisma stoltei TaxID=1481888 RepID=A0AAU9JAB1_9CILI|nr:unnamed protein product [Blepharisma stoltei]